MENVGSLVLQTQMFHSIEGNIKERMSNLNAVIEKARQNNAKIEADMDDHEFSETYSGYTVGAPQMTRGGLDDNGKEIFVKGSFINSENNIGSIVKGSIVKGTLNDLNEIAEEPVEVQVSDSISV